MNLETRKLQFIEEYIHLQNEAIINKLEQLLKKEISKPSITLSDKEKMVVDKAIKSIEKGKGSSHEDVMKRMKKTFPHLHSK